MEFGDMFAKIGTVKQVLDGGAIKARVEGTFDDEDLTKLPPIKYSPFAGDNGFSVPSIGERVWVIGSHSDPLMLFWQPINETSFSQNMHQESEKHKEMLLKEGCSILIKKPMAGGLYESVYYIDDAGCHIQDGNTSLVVSNKDGVTIKAPKIVIGDENSVISIGTGKKQLAYASIVDEKLTKLGAMITKLSKLIEMSAKPNPYTSAIGAAMSAMESDIASLKADIESTGSGVMA